jgi:hypothetical protein
VTLYPYLVVDLPITDTNTHTYRTDPFNPLVLTQPGISLIRLGESVPPVRAFNVYVYNFANAALNVQVIANENAKNYQYGYLLDGLDYQSESSYPDFNVGSAVTVPAGSLNTPSVQAIQSDFYTGAAERYLSVALTYSTAPTSGFVRAHIDLFYEGF